MRDATTGQLNGLQNGPPTPLHPSGTAYSPSPSSDSCHDITTYPEIGLAAGACEGNGLLLDISDPANPVRIHAVADPNYSYWHGATFSNDGKTVVFTDEWGGGTAARCRATDDLSWGADAIYDIVDGKLVFRSYYKLPVAQTLQENCVSHLPSIIPVPGRNIMTQAWYQGGLSVIDFTDSANPKEIALLRPRPDQRHRARARRPLVDLLLQRRHLRLRDRPRLRRVAADPDRGALRERDQGGERGRARPADAAAPAAVHLGPSFAVVRSHLDQLVRGGRDRRRRPSSRRRSSSATPRTSSPATSRTARQEKLRERSRSILRGDPSTAALRQAVLDLEASPRLVAGRAHEACQEGAPRGAPSACSRASRRSRPAPAGRPPARLPSSCARCPCRAPRRRSEQRRRSGVRGPGPRRRARGT